MLPKQVEPNLVDLRQVLFNALDLRALFSQDPLVDVFHSLRQM
jgi:hypothetical protein